MIQSSHFLLTPPDQLDQAQTYGLPLAHMAFQISSDGHLHQGALPPGLKGGLMLVGSQGGGGDPRTTVQELTAACLNRNFGGIILDLEEAPSPYWTRVIRGLEEGLTRQGRTLLLPEAYGRYSNRALLYFSSALSGGSLRRRLEEAADAYGPDRLILSLHRACEDFFLPARTGAGRPLSQQDLQERIHRMSPNIFFSQDLCAHYFTYMSRETGAHFILFDDEASLKKKRALAREIGIRRFFLLFPEVEDCLPALLPEAAV
mgnify:CR=1 FL=1